MNQFQRAFSALCVFSAAFLSGSVTRAESASKQYAICYGQLMGARVPLSDPILKRVQAKEIGAAQACRDLIGTFNSEAIARGDANSLILLSRLNRLHSTFFTANDFYTDDLLYTMADLYEAEAPAYAVTDNFLHNKKMQQLLSGKQQLRGHRVSPVAATHFWSQRMVGEYRKLNHFAWLEPGQTQIFPFIERGELLSIVPDTTSTPLLKQLRQPAGETHLLKPHQGGGILGSPEYIILNSKEAKFDGGLHSFRRYGDRIIKDFLCRDLPVLKESDVTAFVEPKSPLPFRQKQTCMACHSTMDPLGQSIGHVEIAMSSMSTEALQFMYVKPISKPLGSTFRYRTLDDQLIETPVTDVEQVGAAISKLDDFYWCMAKRYYHFVSGKDTVYEPKVAGRTPQQKGVYELAQKLKKNQSLRDLLGDAYSLRFDLAQQAPQERAVQ